jgi:hypothetical protein
MKKEFGYVTDREGNAVAGAEVYIKKQSDSTLVQLYSDNGVTTTSNPLTTDNDGEWQAFFGNETVKVQTFIDGVQQQEVNNHQHFDLSGLADPGADRIAFWDDSAGQITYLSLDTGLSITGTTLSLGLGSSVQAYDAGLAALAAFNTNGILVQTADNTFAGRTLTGTANEITVTNGDGVAGAPTLSLPAALTFTGKTITGGSVTPAAAPTTTAIGYLGSPINTQNAAYTTLMTDAGKTLYHTDAGAHTWTIDSNANVAYPIGTILTFINENGGGDVTIAITSDTLRWGGSTGSRTLSANGVASAIKVASTVWRMTGDGIS